jgi:hypothetical protein
VCECTDLLGDVEIILLQANGDGKGHRRCIASAAGHRREERNLTSSNDGRVEFHMDMIDRGSYHRFLESVSIFLATPDQPLDQVVNGPHRRRRIDGLFRALAGRPEISC